MSWKRVILAWATLLTLVFASAGASARADVSLKPHVGVFDLVVASGIWVNADASAEEHWGKWGLSTADTLDFPFAARGVPQLAQGTRRFLGDSAVTHFSKHASSVSKALGRTSYNLRQYLDDANHVIRNGKWVSELNGYVRLVGGRGSAKAAFVGVDRAAGNITTFHIKTVKELSRKAPSLGWSP